MKRAGNNEGCFFVRKDGRHCCAITIKENGNTKRKYFYGLNNFEIVKKVNNYYNSIKIKIDDISIQQMFLDWLINIKMHTVCSRTMEYYIGLFNVYMKQDLSFMSLEDFNSKNIYNYFVNLQKTNISLERLKKIKQLLSQFNNHLIMQGCFNYNIVNCVDIKKRESKTPKENYKAIPREIRSKFLTVIEKNKFLKTICYLGLFAGLRIGEILALQWEDINFDKKFINIYKSVCREIKFNDEGKVLSKKITITSPKTKNSNRVIPFCNELGKVLEDWKFECWLDSKIINKSFDDKSFLFKDKNSAICSYELVKQRFKRFLAKNNLKQYNIHLHSLRHTFATMLFENKVNPKAIQLLMGHSNIKTTMSVYNSIDNVYIRRLVEKLNYIFK